MASCLGLSCTCLIILAAANTAPIMATKEFKVGNVQGWRQPAVNETELYNHWASRRRFHIGDSLRFHYKNDSVVVVDKWGYYHCNTSNPVSVFNDGNTVVNLDKPGPIYFISGDLDHCKDGQRLIIEVMSPYPISHSPPSIATPPQPYWAVSPAPSPLSSPAASVEVTVISVVVALFVSFIGLVSCSVP